MQPQTLKCQSNQRICCGVYSICISPSYATQVPSYQVGGALQKPNVRLQGGECAGRLYRQLIILYCITLHRVSIYYRLLPIHGYHHYRFELLRTTADDSLSIAFQGFVEQHRAYSANLVSKTPTRRDNSERNAGSRSPNMLREADVQRAKVQPSPPMPYPRPTHLTMGLCGGDPTYAGMSNSVCTSSASPNVPLTSPSSPEPPFATHPGAYYPDYTYAAAGYYFADYSNSNGYTPASSHSDLLYYCYGGNGGGCYSA